MDKKFIAIARVTVALSAVVAGFLLRVALGHWAGPGLPIYITFYPAVMLVALVSGFWPGVLATMASALVVIYWLLPPFGQFAVESAADGIGLVFFILMGVLMSAVAGLYRGIRDRLENLVGERTRELSDVNAALKQQMELVDPARAEVIMIEMQRVLRARRVAGATAVSGASPGDWLLRVATVAGGAVVGVGLLAVAGWAFGVDALKSLLPGLATMKANTALCFVLAGAALLLRDRRPWQTVCAVAVCAVGALTLAEYVSGLDLGIDQLLCHDPGNPETVHPGRMVPATAFAFVLSGASLLMLGARGRNGRWAQQTLAIIVGVLGMVAVLGYAYDVQQLYRFAGLAGMALHTAVGFVLMAVGLIFARLDGLARVLIAPGAGTEVARRLLPTAILLPLVLGWLHEMGERLGVFSPPVGASLLALTIMLSFVTVVWWLALVLNRAATARRETETQLRNQADLMDHAREALIVREMDGAIRFWNRGAAALYGWQAVEALGQRIHVLLRTGGLPQDIDAQLEQTGHWEGEEVHIARDGRRVTVESSKTAIRADDGRVLILESTRDITGRKQAEKALRESEDRLRFALETSHTGAWDLNLVDHTAYRSLEHDRIFGYAELLPRWTYEMFIEHVLPEDRAAVDGKFHRAMESQGDWSFECRIRRADGQVRWIWAAGRHRPDAAGAPRLMAGIVQDITERKKAEEAVLDAIVQKRAAQYSRTLLEVSLDPLVTISAEGKITDVNEAAIKATGAPRDEMVGTDFSSYFTEPEKAREGYQRAFARGFVTDYPLTICHRNGRLMDVLYNASVYKDADGNVLGVFAAARDVTAQKKAEGALKEANARLEQRVSERTAALAESEARVRRKLDSVLSPEGDLGALDLGDIIDIPAIQTLMDHFYKLAHIPMSIIDLKGKLLVGIGWQEICMRFHRAQPDSCRNCVESDMQLTAGVPPGEARLYKCKNNMWDIATPILVGGRRVGNLFSGQFFFDDESPDYDLFRAQARQYGFKEDEYIAAMRAVPRFSRETVNTGMAFFMKFTDILSRLSYGNIKLARLLAERDTLLASIKESEQRLSRAQEISHLGSWELDLLNSRLTWSDEVYRIFGLKPQEFDATYEAFLERVHPEDRAAVDAAYSGSLREGKDTYGIEHRVVRKSDGEIRVVHEKCEHVRDAGGKIVRSVGMVHDITERKKAEEELRRVNENLEQFAYVASHDLQEPLRIMSSFSQLLEKRYKNKLDENANEFIGFIVDAAARMQKLITDLLMYSRAGHKSAELDEVDCNQLVSRVVTSMASTIESAGGSISCARLPVIRAHEASMIQLFQNLIGNAIKFRSERKLEIHINARRIGVGKEHGSAGEKENIGERVEQAERTSSLARGASWLFSVRDNGIGIEPQYHDRIFVIFQRLHPRDKYAGTGIGLSICKKIVENLGGKIWMESEPDKGSIFYFTLPGGRVKNNQEKRK